MPQGIFRGLGPNTGLTRPSRSRVISKWSRWLHGGLLLTGRMRLDLGLPRTIIDWHGWPLSRISALLGESVRDHGCLLRQTAMTPVLYTYVQAIVSVDVWGAEALR